jgi:zona occludens toxin
MAIHLTTGLPGAGKTLRTLFVVEKLRQDSGRDVYYNGINDLRLPWLEFDDPTKWCELPDNSIIVIDEAQRAFRPRAAVLKVPPHVEALETHRHRGIDIYVITQHPLLIEQNMRRLVESHEHMMNKFGSKWATVHEWKGVKENCDKSRADSIQSEFRYPVEVYGWYKSAESHTKKFKLPGKVIVLICTPFVFIAVVWYVVSKMSTFGKPKDVPESAVVQKQLSGSVEQKSLGQPAIKNVAARGSATDFQSPEDWLQARKPRFAALPWSAPHYDELTQPVRVPVIRGCIITPEPLPGRPSRFMCMLDGGVYIYPPQSFVEQFLRDRMFIDFERNARAGDIAASQPRAGDLATQRPVNAQ